VEERWKLSSKGMLMHLNSAMDVEVYYRECSNP
jgi:hypothetical protein